MVVIYKKKNFKIYDAGTNYIVHNTRLNFKEHHTHIKNFHTCKFLIDMSIHESIPEKHLSDYLLVSLIRLSNNKVYINKLNHILDDNKERHKQNRKRYQQWKKQN